MESADGVEEGADDFAHHATSTRLGVVEEDVGNAVGDFADGGSTDTCGEEVVDGWAVGLAEEFPREGADEGIEEGDTIGESVLACGIVEHTAVVGMGELVAREAVVVPHPSACQVLVDVLARHTCPLSVGDEVVPTEDDSVDAKVFHKGLQGRGFHRAV